MATNCVSVHRIYIALEPSLDGKEPTAFKAVVLSFFAAFARNIPSFGCGSAALRVSIFVGGCSSWRH